ncbi:C39 family peptidase [Candidatus Woesebacteria bacterium]|nr:C39 family peptidase [Candidatus Woesebacteria bacterium]
MKKTLSFTVFTVIFFIVTVFFWWQQDRIVFVPEILPSPEENLRKPLAERFTEVLQKPESSPSPTPSVELPPFPEQTVISGGTHTFQTFNNCGPASLSMALSLYGISASQRELGQELRPYQNSQGDNDDKSVTLAEVAAEAEEYGFVVYHRPAGTIEQVKHFIAQDIPVVARTWLTPEEDIGHFRVLKGYDESTQEIIQDDSLQGADLRFSYDYLEEIWQPFNAEFLVLVPPEKQAIAEAILGDLLDEESAWEAILARAQAAQSGNPQDVYAPFNEAVALYHLGRYDEAKQAYESVADQLPSRMLWYQIEPILVYWKLGEYGQVLSMTEVICKMEIVLFLSCIPFAGKFLQRKAIRVLQKKLFS